FGGEFVFFFFSSRRRHTRWPRDWSSDVCSSDLWSGARVLIYTLVDLRGSRYVRDASQWSVRKRFSRCWSLPLDCFEVIEPVCSRSEERRVGKECKSWVEAYAQKKVI